jgi:hypothetical protein
VKSTRTDELPRQTPWLIGEFVRAGLGFTEKVNWELLPGQLSNEVLMVYVTVSCIFPEFVKVTGGTGFEVPEPVAGLISACPEKDQLYDTPEAGMEARLTGDPEVPEQMTWDEGEDEAEATGLTWIV